MTLRDAYADNGHNGDNVHYVLTGVSHFDIRWSPVYCVYGRAHRIVAHGPRLTCHVCKTVRDE